jgi:GNAT superfamily N-acetyltransferase
MSEVRVRRVEPGEGERLREIATAAKSHWGYDLDRVKEWAEDGDFSDAGLRGKNVYVAVVDGAPVGWASALARAEVWWLDDLWVAPAWMGKGVGSPLFARAAGEGRAAGARRMEWEAEPNAVGFYERMGARRVRAGEPSVWGRVNPVLGIDLTDGAAPGVD